MAPPETKNNGLFPFWEWIQGVFAPRPGGMDASGDRPPPRRGIAITVCILVSAFLWFTFTIRGVYTATITFPTAIHNLPDDEALASLPPENVRVQVEGEGFALIRLNYNPPTVPIDASNDVVGIEETVRRLPQGVRITNVSPTTFNLRKESRITRTIPIQPRIDVRTPSTHDLLEPPVLTPDSVRVTGAVSIVSDLEFWPTEERVFRDVRDSVAAVVTLADTLDGLVQRSVQSTFVRARSRQFTEGMREIPVNVIGGPDRAVTLDPSSIRVRYRVLFSQYQDALEAPDFFSTVSFEDVLTDTTGRVRPTLHLPSDIVLRDIEMIPPILRYFQRLD